MAGDLIRIIDAEELTNEAIAYLYDKYGVSFSPFKTSLYTTRGEHIVRVAILDEFGDFTQITTVICTPVGDDEWKFSDNYTNHLSRQAFIEEVTKAAEPFGKKTVVFHKCWFGDHFAGKDDELGLSVTTLAENAGRLFGQWYIFIEAEGDKKSADEIYNRLKAELKSRRFYGSFSLFITGLEVLELIDEDNFSDYLTDEEYDGAILVGKYDFKIVRE